MAVRVLRKHWAGSFGATRLLKAAGVVVGFTFAGPVPPEMLSHDKEDFGMGADPVTALRAIDPGVLPVAASDGSFYYHR